MWNLLHSHAVNLSLHFQEIVATLPQSFIQYYSPELCIFYIYIWQLHVSCFQ